MNESKPTRDGAIRAAAQVLVAYREDLVRAGTPPMAAQPRARDEVLPIDTKSAVEAVLIDAKEVAAMTGLSVYTVRQMARQGRIPARKVGRFTRFVRAEVDAWIEHLPQASR